MSQSPDAPLANAPTREATLPELGTYYRRESSPGFLSRILIVAIDAGVLLATAGGMLSLLDVLTPKIPFRIESLIIMVIGCGCEVISVATSFIGVERISLGG